MITKWEYKIVTVDKLNNDDTVAGDYLGTQFGQYGWELVALMLGTPDGVRTRLIFKRPEGS